jgi:hypothetical protein
MGAEYLFLSYRAECSAAKAELNPKIITRADGVFYTVSESRRITAI